MARLLNMFGMVVRTNCTECYFSVDILFMLCYTIFIVRQLVVPWCENQIGAGVFPIGPRADILITFCPLLFKETARGFFIAVDICVILL